MPRPKAPKLPAWLVPSRSPGSEGTCARQDWCSDATVEIQADGTRKIVPASTPRGFCEACTTLLGARLEELPAAWVRLHLERFEQPSRRSKDIRSPLGPTVNLRTDVDSLLRLMAITLGGWEARVRQAAGLSRDVSQKWGTGPQIAGAVDTISKRLSVLLALQPDWTARTIPMPVAGSETGVLPDDIELLWAGHEIRRRYIDGVCLWAKLDGTAAGLEILDLHYRARSILGETRAPRETLDGVPCRSCEAMSLERAEPPSDPSKPAPYSVCSGCAATMSEKDYRGWSAWYSGWANGVVEVCARCAKEDHGACDWDACRCAAGGHGVPLAA